MHFEAAFDFEKEPTRVEQPECLLFNERIRAVDPKHAHGFQLLGGDVTAHSSMRSITAIRAIRNLHAS